MPNVATKQRFIDSPDKCKAGYGKLPSDCDFSKCTFTKALPEFHFKQEFLLSEIRCVDGADSSLKPAESSLTESTLRRCDQRATITVSLRTEA